MQSQEDVRFGEHYMAVGLHIPYDLVMARTMLRQGQFQGSYWEADVLRDLKPDEIPAVLR
jgi:hypothetical protein